MTKPLSANKGKTAPNVKSEKKPKSAKKITDSSKLKESLTELGKNGTTVSPKSNNKLCSFHSEISGMMYAFGDNRKPLPDSVTLVEEIVHHQMSSVLVQATEVTNMRGGRFTSIDDVLFLMKNNKCKLRRVIRYLRLKDQKSKSVKPTSPDEEDVLESVVTDSTGKSDAGKRLKLAYDFISSIDGTGELVALFEEQDYMDNIKLARMKRAERMSRCLDSQAYVEYSEARQMCFSKKIAKFKDWLGIGTSFDIKASTAVIEILSNLAYETVHEIVDLALLIKEDQERTDILSSNIEIAINPLSEIAKSTNTKQPQIPKGALPTPTHSPPGTPISTPHSSTQNITTSLTAPIHGGLASSLGTASLASSLSGLGKPSKAKKKKTKHSMNAAQNTNSTRIQPSHIREAVRRYTMSRTPITPLVGFSRSSLLQRTLCL